MSLNTGNAILSNAITVSSTYNVGIGTNTPTSKVHAVNVGNGFIYRFAGGTSSEITGGIFASTATGFASIGTQSNHTFNIFTNDTDRVTITSSGNVGIGTSSPNTYTIAPQLVVDSGASGGGLTIKTGTTSSTTNYGGVFFADGTTGSEQYRGFIQYNHNFNSLTDTLILGTAGTEKMYITSGGNVGIGTSSPSRRLTVPSDGSNWISGVFGGAGGSDVVVVGNLYGPTIGGHNSTLTAWAPLLLNPDGGNVGTGTTSASTHFQIKKNVWSFFAEKQHGSNANFCSINFNGATGSAIIQIANSSYKPGQDTYAGCLTIFVYTTNGTTININTISTYGTSYVGTSISSGVLYLYFTYAGPTTNYSNASVTINGTGNQNTNTPLTVTML